MADETPQPNPDPSPYFAYWRPLLGWISVIGLALEFIVFRVIEAVLAFLGHPVTLPHVDTSSLMAMVTTSVSMGGMRSVEKVFKVHDKH